MSGLIRERIDNFDELPSELNVSAQISQSDREYSNGFDVLHNDVYYTFRLSNTLCLFLELPSVWDTIIPIDQRTISHEAWHMQSEIGFTHFMPRLIVGVRAIRRILSRWREYCDNLQIQYVSKYAPSAETSMFITADSLTQFARATDDAERKSVVDEYVDNNLLETAGALVRCFENDYGFTFTMPMPAIQGIWNDERIRLFTKVYEHFKSASMPDIDVSGTLFVSDIKSLSWSVDGAKIPWSIGGEDARWSASKSIMM